MVDGIQISDIGAGLVAGSSQYNAYQVNDARTSIVVNYQVGRMIADRVMPKTMVGPKFDYRKGKIGEQLSIPDDKIPETGTPRIIEFASTLEPGRTVPHGYRALVPQRVVDEILNDQRSTDPSMRQSMQLFPQQDPLDSIALMLKYMLTLSREKRVADIVFNTASYAAAQWTAVAKADAWKSNRTTADPNLQIETAINAMLTPPDAIVFGSTAWTYYSTHPQVAGTLAFRDRKAMKEEVAERFDVSEVLLGTGKYNSGTPDSPTISRLWGGSVALIYRGALATMQQMGGEGSVNVNQEPVMVDRMLPTYGFQGVYREETVLETFHEERGSAGAYDIIVREDSVPVLADINYAHLLTGVDQ